MSLVVAIAGKTRSNLAGFQRRLARWQTALFSTYRPELYYMRGPGPKWRQKHAQSDQ